MLRIAVVSGKGGVGKSTLVASLALTLRDRTGVGIADLDIEKPSIATILGVEDSEVSVRNDRFVPAKVRGIELVSSDLLFPSKAALLWSKRQEEEASAQMVELT
ncbi:MAG: P-loop NTPase, partial [Deltaproteobacteria bacterium]|nr:P-loop NTPase [Deltaproteobacteria bacterium]